MAASLTSLPPAPASRSPLRWHPYPDCPTCGYDRDGALRLDGDLCERCTALYRDSTATERLWRKRDEAAARLAQRTHRAVYHSWEGAR